MALTNKNTLGTEFSGKSALRRFIQVNSVILTQVVKQTKKNMCNRQSWCGPLSAELINPMVYSWTELFFYFNFVVLIFFAD